MEISAASARKVRITPIVTQLKTPLAVELKFTAGRANAFLGLLPFGKGLPPGPFWIGIWESVSSDTL